MRQPSYYNNSQAATTNLPFGAYKDESVPGAHDGTNIEAEHLQDILYSLFQVLQMAGITPNNVLEDGNNNKQFIGALANIGILPYSAGITYKQNALAINPGTTQIYKSVSEQ